MRVAVGVTVAVCAITGSAASAAPSDGIHNIRHVVMIMQENRSFDSYFGTYPGANGIPAGTCVPDPVNGGCVRPFHESTDKNYGGAHGTRAAVLDIDGGRMDGFVGDVEQEMGCTAGEPRCQPCGSPQATAKTCVDVMGYHDAREIPNYWTYAQSFSLQDNMFESVASMSLPSHVSLVSGWSARCPEGDANPLDCVSALSPGSAPRTWTDITYLLHRAQVSWRYYVAEGTEPDCENDEALSCEPEPQGSKTESIWNPLPSFTDVHQDGQLEDIQSLTNFYTAVHDQTGCGLPNVAWLAPSGESSEHPPNPIGRGQAYVTTLVNAVMRSPCWNSTAIFISWDDWGGFYDHVMPPPIDRNGYGLRVPSLVISPYAKTGYIDHQQLSFDAYLKFIEDDFLERARLNPRTDGRPDSRPDVREEAPGLGNLANDFDFSQAPRSPLILSTHPEPGPASNPPDLRPPSVETLSASAVGPASATLRATVNPNGGSVSDCHFEYGTSTSYGSSVPCASSPGSGFGAVEASASVGALSANTAYHFRIVAANASGTGDGADQSFTTLPSPPAVETGEASGAGDVSATLGATVNPNGGSVSDCHFEYGASASYGTSVSCATPPGAGSSPVEVSAQVARLSAGTTYHFRIVAANAGGLSTGADETFTTATRPEYGRCLKAARGLYATGSCTSPATTESSTFEWYPGPGPNAAFTTRRKPETVVALTTAARRRVTCTGETSSGEYTGPTTVGRVVIAFTGCEGLAAPCGSAGAAEGEIVTAPLAGTIGWESKLEHKVGEDLSAAERGGPIAEFNCGATSVVLRGSVIGPVVAGRMLSSATVSYSQLAGRQRTERLEGEPPDILECSFLGSAFEQAGLTLTATQANGEPMEANWFA